MCRTGQSSGSFTAGQNLSRTYGWKQMRHVTVSNMANAANDILAGILERMIGGLTKLTAPAHVPVSVKSDEKRRSGERQS